MATDLQQAYDYCRQVTRERARNFYFGFRTLPARKREAIYAAYAFCRECDDIADGPGSVQDKRLRLADTRALLEQSFNGAVSAPVFAALKDAASAFDIPVAYFRQVIDGAEMDLSGDRYKTFEDLRKYCYKVASVVGLISIEVFGYRDPAARDHAVDLGIAMQLTNILRDLKEDAQRGRIYIPQDEMAGYGYSEADLQAGVVNDAFRSLMSFQIERARRYFQGGENLLPLLSPRSRACPAVLSGVYGAILDRIETSGYDVFQRRISLGAGEKWLLMARIWTASLIPARSRPRA